VILGLTDIQVTEEEFRRLKIPCKKVFILENKTNFSNLMNFLTLPQLENTIGIFGSGYKVADLKNASWLSEKEISTGETLIHMDWTFFRKSGVTLNILRRY